MVVGLICYKKRDGELETEKEDVGAGGGYKETKITKAWVCLSLVFSTPLHKIRPSLSSIPSLLSPSAPPSSLSLVSRSAPQSHKLVLASSKWLRVHWERREGSREGERRQGSRQHHSLRSSFQSEESWGVGDERQPLCWTLTGLTGHQTHTDLFDFPRFSSNMSSSSSNLHNKRLPCE